MSRPVLVFTWPARCGTRPYSTRAHHLTQLCCRNEYNQINTCASMECTGAARNKNTRSAYRMTARFENEQSIKAAAAAAAAVAAACIVYRWLAVSSSSLACLLSIVASFLSLCRHKRPLFPLLWEHGVDAVTAHEHRGLEGGDRQLGALRATRRREARIEGIREREVPRDHG